MDDLKSVLNRLLKKVPNYQQRLHEMEVYEVWPSIVGEKLAKQCWPVKLLDDGVLLIAATSSAWLQSLRYLEPQILAKYEKALKSKKVKALRFKLQTSRE